MRTKNPPDSPRSILPNPHADSKEAPTEERDQQKGCQENNSNSKTNNSTTSRRSPEMTFTQDHKNAKPIDNNTNNPNTPNNANQTTNDHFANTQLNHLEEACDGKTFEDICNVDHDDDDVDDNDDDVDDLGAMYHRNKLYQPLNGHQDDDEYLSYPELQYLESMAQLTGILDEDEPDDNQLNRDSEDPLDRLQMTTFIETFDSFQSSPMIDDRDPLITSAIHNQSSQEKPDSTMQIHPAGSCENNITPSSYISHHSSDQFIANHEIQQTTLIGDHNSPQSQFYSFINNDNCSVLSESHHGNKELRLQEFNLQDKNSENEGNSFQQHNHQVSSSFATNTHENAPDLNNKSAVTNKKNKRTLQESNLDDSPSNQLKASKSRAKKKSRVLAKDTGQDNTESTKLNQSNVYKTNEYQAQHIQTNEQKTNLLLIEQSKGSMDQYEDEEMMFDDETSSVSGSCSSRNPHMNKYRRRTANARERIRMREINQAFEKLKKVVPVELIRQQTASDYESEQSNPANRRSGKGSNQTGSESQSVKLTKITTLRLAVSYIAQLSDVLNQHMQENGQDRTSSSIVSVSSNQSSALIRNEKDVEKSANKKRSRNKSKRDNSRTTSIKTDVIKERVNENKHVEYLDNPDTKLVNQQQQKQPIIITNQFQTTNTTTLVPIQAQKPQQLAFAQHCTIRQPLTISQAPIPNSIIANQDRTFVTPVAVAILGIPTNNGQNMNERQQLQLLGIQGASQQTNSQTYNLMAQHPQHVTLTLDDVNGLSVLRLANSNGNNTNSTISLVNTNQSHQQQQQQHQHHQQQQPNYHLQQSCPTTIIQHQAQVLSNGYNYATYQPIQFSHLQTSNSMNASIRTNLTQPSTGSIQIRNSTGSTFSDNNAIQSVQEKQRIYNDLQRQQYQQQQQQQQLLGNSKVMMIKSLESRTTNTGIVSQDSIKIQPEECRQQLLDEATNGSSSRDNQQTDNKQQFDKMKFVSQFQRQDRNAIKNTNEANINQLVASLATSIQPSKGMKSSSDDQNYKDLAQKQQQQQKRTYRFHNYDGNMITNNLYGSQPDKQNQQLATNVTNKKAADQEQSSNSINGSGGGGGTGQRSRQNSLSSTCSTISSSSSSLISSTSPTTSIMIKSPTLENDNRS